VRGDDITVEGCHRREIGLQDDDVEVVVRGPRGAGAEERGVGGLLTC